MADAAHSIAEIIGGILVLFRDLGPGCCYYIPRNGGNITASASLSSGLPMVCTFCDTFWVIIENREKYLPMIT